MPSGSIMPEQITKYIAFASLIIPVFIMIRDSIRSFNLKQSHEIEISKFSNEHGFPNVINIHNPDIIRAIREQEYFFAPFNMEPLLQMAESQIVDQVILRQAIYLNRLIYGTIPLILFSYLFLIDGQPVIALLLIILWLAQFRAHRRGSKELREAVVSLTLVS